MPKISAYPYISFIEGTIVGRALLGILKRSRSFSSHSKVFMFISIYLEALVASVIIFPVSLNARKVSIVPKTQRFISRRSFTRGTLLISHTILDAEK